MIKKPEAFKRMPPAGFNGVFDWDFLLPAFNGTKIQPTDIDGSVERNDQVLFFETKTPGKEMEEGQRRMFESLIKTCRGKLCLFILWGKSPDTITSMEEWHFSHRKDKVVKKPRTDCNSETVLQRVSEWFLWANNGRQIT